MEKVGEFFQYILVQSTEVRGENIVYISVMSLSQRKLKYGKIIDNKFFSHLETTLLQLSAGIDLDHKKDDSYSIEVILPSSAILKSSIQKMLTSAGFKYSTLPQGTLKDHQKFRDMIGPLTKISLEKHMIGEGLEHALSGLSYLVEDNSIYRGGHYRNTLDLEAIELDNFVRLDTIAVQALELLPNAYEKENAKQIGNSNLFSLLNHCSTKMGERCLKRWILQPLKDIGKIMNRQAVVQLFVDNQDLLSHFDSKILSRIPDFELYAKKFFLKKVNKTSSCGLRDIYKIYSALKTLDSLKDHFDHEDYKKEEIDTIKKQIVSPILILSKIYQPLKKKIAETIDLEAADHRKFRIQEKTLPELQKISRKLKFILTQVKTIHEEARTDLGSHIKTTESDSYRFLFVVSKKKHSLITTTYSSKYDILTTRANDVTFITNELKELSVEYRELEEEYLKHQKIIETKLLAEVAEYYETFSELALFTASLDVLASFANVVRKERMCYQGEDKETMIIYTRPKFSKSGQISFREAKHPCLLSRIHDKCIGNNLSMKKGENNFHVITGPNMGGKSTYIRQIAINLLLAHIGAYCCAESAEVPLLDAIITRVGADDRISNGLSTFMTEMVEVSSMLSTAKEHSFLIIDELGRGTSSETGYGLTRAIAKQIASKIGSYCLFSTHFSQVTNLAQEEHNIQNFSMEVRKEHGEMKMKYKLTQDKISQSYGFNVLKLLKISPKIIKKAEFNYDKVNEFFTKMQPRVGDQANGKMIEEQFPQTEEEKAAEERFLKLKEYHNFKEHALKLIQTYKIRIKDETDPEVLKNLKKELKEKITIGLLNYSQENSN